MKLYYPKVIIGILSVAVVALTVFNIYQAQVIEVQRHLMMEMFRFIQAGCPFNMMQ